MTSEIPKPLIEINNITLLKNTLDLISLLEIKNILSIFDFLRGSIDRVEVFRP